MARYFNPKKRAAFFDQILVDVPNSNTFDLSHSNKLSFNMGDLVPILTQEVYPGDKFNISTEHLIKLAPLVFPTMHRCKVQTHYFFVPSRVLWDGFEAYQAYDTLNEIPEHPFINLNTNTEAGNRNVVEVGSLADYMGIPTGDYDANYTPDHPMAKLNALPFAAYYKIFDDYYRDQDLTPEKFGELEDGDNSLQSMFLDTGLSSIFSRGNLLKRAWEKDYFTSARPFAQKGQEVVMPLGETAEVDWIAKPDGASGDFVRDPRTGALIGTTGSQDIVNVEGLLSSAISPGDDEVASIDNTNNLIVNLKNAIGAKINDLRIAIRMQEFFERNARLGTRYIEQMLGKFGVRISDERAHRSEYLGGTTAPLVFGEVLQTSSTDTTPLGQQAGYGNSINSDRSVNFYCEEHGWIIGIISILPETNYSQGLHKKFIKDDILDYYDPKFANLGEQAIEMYELFANTQSNNPLQPNYAKATFGYQSRYAELKYNNSEVHGEFRTTLKAWHMAREFAEAPQLSSQFVESQPTHDIFADTDPENDKIYCYLHHRIIARRKIPYFSTPNLQGFN